MKVELKKIQNVLHISNNSHDFQWSVLSIAPRYTFKWTILEAYFIKMMEPSLNSQMNNDVLTLLRNGITQTPNPKCSVNNRFYDTHPVYKF